MCPVERPSKINSVITPCTNTKGGYYDGMSIKEDTTNIFKNDRGIYKLPRPYFKTIMEVSASITVFENSVPYHVFDVFSTIVL